MAIEYGKHIFPEYQIPASSGKQEGTTAKNAAYATLPANAVRPVKRTSRQYTSGNTMFALGLNPLFIFTTGPQEYLDITSIECDLYGAYTHPGGPTAHQLSFTSIFGSYAGYRIYIEYLVNDRKMYQVESWTGTGQVDPTPIVSGDRDLPNPFESNASENYFHLVVKPNETFKIGVRNGSAGTIFRSSFGLDCYDNNYIETVVCGRLIPKQLYEKVQLESGYSL